MRSFGQVIVAARKAAGLTQKSVAEWLRRADGRRVLPPFLNDLEHDRRYPPEDEVINQLADILGLSADVLYLYAKRLSPDVRRDASDTKVEAAYRAFREVLADQPRGFCPTVDGRHTTPVERTESSPSWLTAVCVISAQCNSASRNSLDTSPCM